MKHITKLKLALVQMVCDDRDKSTEYMFQLMQDVVKVDHNAVHNYFEMPVESRAALIQELMKLNETALELDKLFPDD